MNFEQWLQSRLTAHGYSPGPIDGQIGRKTIAAIKAFQAAKGLPASGQADAATIAALRASSTAGAVAPVSREAAPPSAPPGRRWPHQNDVPSFYGAVGQSQVLLELPFPMVLAWDKRRVISRISVHSRVAASAGSAFRKIESIYSPADRRALGIDIFGGSLNVRKMRGGSRYSMHAWGIALDFDPERNQLKWGAPKARLSHADAVPFWQAWEAEGWLSLGRARNFDWQHIQAARL